jgi:hypothetical protein
MNTATKLQFTLKAKGFLTTWVSVSTWIRPLFWWVSEMRKFWAFIRWVIQVCNDKLETDIFLKVYAQHVLWNKVILVCIFRSYCQVTSYSSHVCLSSLGSVGRSLRLTTHDHLVLRLKIRGALLPRPPRVAVLKQSDKFIPSLMKLRKIWLLWHSRSEGNCLSRWGWELCSVAKRASGSKLVGQIEAEGHTKCVCRNFEDISNFILDCRRHANSALCTRQNTETVGKWFWAQYKLSVLYRQEQGIGYTIFI